MPGSRITDRQVRLYMQAREQGKSQEAAAAQAGVSVRSGRRVERGEREAPAAERHWRTRPDPLEAVWESELVPLLRREPTLSGITLHDYLEERYPGRYPASILRTLQRRIKHWRATEGPAKEVIFRQQAVAGRLGLSDFTKPSLGVTIDGQALVHQLYHYRLAYSGWRYVKVILGGESFTALSEGLQNAWWRCGGVPQEHRTDSLSAAFCNQHPDSERDLTEAYEVLCAHYGVTASRNNRGVAHENGAIEAAHGSLKRHLDQALKLRGSREFAELNAYEQFVERIVTKLNRRVAARFNDERTALRALPPRRSQDYTPLVVKVTRSSTIEVRRVLYTVPSKLIGEALRIHLFDDRLEGYLGAAPVIRLQRVYPGAGRERARSVDYRHLIDSLAAKPQAFRYSMLRDDLLPDAQYRWIWSTVDARLPPREACKWMVGVLALAARYDCQQRLGEQLVAALLRDQLPTLKTLQAQFLPEQTPPPIEARQHALYEYDQLLHPEHRHVH